MTDLKKEIEKLETEIDGLIKPLVKKLRDLKDQREVEYKAEKDKLYKDNIAGRLFYADVTTWSGFTDSIRLIKPDNCINWDRYDSCDGFEITMHYTDMRWNKDTSIEREFERLVIKREEFRIDGFATQYKELTPEVYLNFCDKLNAEVIAALQLFNPLKK